MRQCVRQGPRRVQIARRGGFILDVLYGTNKILVPEESPEKMPLRNGTVVKRRPSPPGPGENPMDEEHEARKALEEGQFQIDDDGHTIGVSRQALCETLGAYDTMRQSLATKTQEVADLTERVGRMTGVLHRLISASNDCLHGAHCCCLKGSGFAEIAKEALAPPAPGPGVVEVVEIMTRLQTPPSPKCPKCERKP